MKIRTYLVEGSGPFPIDMLRYDMSWPFDSSDSGRISSPPMEIM